MSKTEQLSAKARAKALCGDSAISGHSHGLTVDPKDAENLRKSLAQLVLQIVNLLRQLMERQAVRKMPSLSPEKQELLGLHLMLLAEKMEEMRKYFGIEKEDMELGLLEDLEELVDSTLGTIAGREERG